MSGSRAEKLIGAFDGDAILISSAKNRYYYSGFTGSEAFLVLTGDENFIFTDSRYHIQAKQQASDFTLIDIAKQQPADFMRERGFAQIGFEEEFMSVRDYERFTKKLVRATMVGVNAQISEQRKRKDPSEIEAIRTAAQIADRAFSYILGELRPGRTERELALLLEFFMCKEGAEGVAFESVFASGVRSAMPHGAASDKVLETGDFVTMDFGCLCRGYCSDMTRTVVLGRANAKQKEIYDIVLRAQTAVLPLVKAGAKTKELDAAARNIIADAGYGEAFGHSLGHSLGLDVHEFPSLSPRSEEILDAGMLVTDEPGIYLEGFGGVRIEDLLLVTETGCENLTGSEKNLIEL